MLLSVPRYAERRWFRQTSSPYFCPLRWYIRNRHRRWSGYDRRKSEPRYHLLPSLLTQASRTQCRQPFHKDSNLSHRPIRSQSTFYRLKDLYCHHQDEFQDTCSNTDRKPHRPKWVILQYLYFYRKANGNIRPGHSRW